jgi:hypothetical protein
MARTAAASVILLNVFILLFLSCSDVIHPSFVFVLLFLLLSTIGFCCWGRNDRAPTGAASSSPRPTMKLNCVSVFTSQILLFIHQGAFRSRKVPKSFRVEVLGCSVRAIALGSMALK